MTYRLPSLNSLRAFEAAARHLSFKGAADELGVTAGAVSQQVKKLEHSLGLDLFRRLPHGLLLTNEGERYLPRITRIFEDLTDATEEIAPDMNGKKFSVGICPKAIKSLPSNWPFSDPNLSSYIRDRIEGADIESIRANEVDCLISTRAYDYPEMFSVLCGTDHVRVARRIHFTCKTSLSNCRQTKAMLSSLKIHTTMKARPSANKDELLD